MRVRHHLGRQSRSRFWEEYLVELGGPIAVTFAPSGNGNHKGGGAIGAPRASYAVLGYVCQACGQRVRTWLHSCYGEE